MKMLFARMIRIIFNLALTWFSSMDPPEGIVPNGYSCGESMVMKCTIQMKCLVNIEIDLRGWELCTYELNYKPG